MSKTKAIIYGFLTVLVVAVCWLSKTVSTGDQGMKNEQGPPTPKEMFIRLGTEAKRARQQYENRLQEANQIEAAGIKTSAPSTTREGSTVPAKLPAQESLSSRHAQASGSADAVSAVDQDKRDRVLQEPLDKLHAWEIAIAYSGLLCTNAITAPCFSPDGGSILLGQKQNESPVLAIYRLRDHKLLKSLRPLSVPSVVAWSPDTKRLAYRAYGGFSQQAKLHVVEIESGKDVSLPVSFGNHYYALEWKVPGELSYGEATLDLETLQVTSSGNSTQVVRGGGVGGLQGVGDRNHPFCDIYSKDIVIDHVLLQSKTPVWGLSLRTDAA